MPEQPDNFEADGNEHNQARHIELTEGELESNSNLDRLVDMLKQGNLSHDQQLELSDHIHIEPSTVHQVHQSVQQTSFRGPLPHPDLLNKYDDATRKIIVEMAAKEQDFSHDMHRTGLKGNINKDRRGQLCGVTIAVVGLIAAVLIAPYSAFAAGIIGTLDLFGMVALFVAPRVLEGRRNKKAVEDDELQDAE